MANKANNKLKVICAFSGGMAFMSLLAFALWEMISALGADPSYADFFFKSFAYLAVTSLVTGAILLFRRPLR